MQLMQKPLQLWHQRFGHLGVKNLKLLHDENLADGFNLNDSKNMAFCEACIKGKRIRSSFPKGQATRATELLEIVHSDVLWADANIQSWRKPIL